MRNLIIFLLLSCSSLFADAFSPQSVTGTISTSAAPDSVVVNFNGAGCVGIIVSGTWTSPAGGMPVQQSNDGVLWQPADALQQLVGKWVESVGTNGRYYTGGLAAKFVRVLGPTGTGTATVSLYTSNQPCNVYAFAIPGSEAGNGFFGGAVSATVTQTTVADSIQGHDSADIGVVWSGITGSPSGCTLQPQYFFGQAGPAINTGPPLPLTPGINQVLTAIGPFGLAVQFVYNCTTFPGAGTISIQITYKPGGKTLISGSQPEVTAAWTSATGNNTSIQQTTAGYGDTMVYLNQGTTITGGSINFETSDTVAFTNAYPIQCKRSDGTVVSVYVLQASTNFTFKCTVNAQSYFRVRLSPAITGTGTVNIGITSIVPPSDSVVAIANNPSVFVAGVVTTSGIDVPQQGTTLLNAAPTVSGANAAATVTLTGTAGQRICIRTIAVKCTGAACSAPITIADAATTVLDLGTQTVGLNGPADIFTGTPFVCGTTGNSMTVNIGAAGAAAVTTTTVVADKQ